MINNSTLIHDVAPDELTENIRSVIREELSLLSTQKTTPCYLTRKEASRLLKISLVTLDEYTRKKIIKGSRIGTRVLYSEEDIKEALKEIAEQKYKRR